MDKNTKELLQNQSAKNIGDLFMNHQIDCRVEENILVFKKEMISLEIYCFDKSSRSDLSIIQLDVNINYGVNPIIESFAGLGKDLETASIDAFKNFTNNSFHTILSAFFTSRYDVEIEKYTSRINGKDFEVFSSNLGVRGENLENLSHDWLSQIEIEIKKLPLDEGVQWVRIYYAQQNYQTTVCEVLLNNEPCVPILQKVDDFDWHKREGFYSLRVFMILKNGIDYKRVVKLIGNEQDYDKLFSGLERMGLSKLEIEKAYSFMPEAFGRKLIQDMGVKGDFSNQSGIINTSKEKFEVNLNDEKIFVQATKYAKEFTKNGWNDDLKSIAFMSAAFNTLNGALKDGVDIEGIDCKNINTMFLIPTYSEPKSSKEKKPFWKIW